MNNPTAATAERVITHRQSQVWRLLARGLTDKQIARDLRVAPATASTHRKRLYKTIGVANRVLVAKLWHTPEVI